MPQPQRRDSHGRAFSWAPFGASFPSDPQGEVGNRWKELFVSVSSFNPAARGWEAAVEEEGGAFKKPTFHAALRRSGIPLTCRTEGRNSVAVPVGWIQAGSQQRG